MEFAIFVLAGVLVFQQIFFLFQIQRLLNKLMSRHYYDYKVAEVIKPFQPQQQKPIEEMQEDMGALQDLI